MKCEVCVQCVFRFTFSINRPESDAMRMSQIVALRRRMHRHKNDMKLPRNVAVFCVSAGMPYAWPQSVNAAGTNGKKTVANEIKTRMMLALRVNMFRWQQRQLLHRQMNGEDRQRNSCGYYYCGNASWQKANEFVSSAQNASVVWQEPFVFLVSCERRSTLYNNRNAPENVRLNLSSHNFVFHSNVRQRIASTCSLCAPCVRIYFDFNGVCVHLVTWLQAVVKSPLNAVKMNA